MRRLLPRTRRTQRHSVSLPCQIVRERDFRLVADCVLDLSQSGMLVGPASPVLTGERLIASFQLPDSGYWIDVEATVARVVHGRRPGENVRALGISFENIPGFAELVLSQTLQAVPSTSPSIRPGRRRSAPLDPKRSRSR